MLFCVKGGNMNYLLLFVISFLIVYLVYYLIVVARKKGVEAFKTGKQVMFFKNAYKLDLEKLDYKKFANSLSLVNAFIIAFTVTIIELIDGFVFKLLVGFVILIPLILICYYVLGKIYKKKEGK
jgi:ABC-type maltose transport system permease subunit